MKKSRCFVLLCLLFSLLFGFCSLASPIASASNLKKATKLGSISLKSSISGATVTNTLYRGSVALRAYDSSNHLLGATTLDSSDGYGSLVNLSSDISYFVIAIPRSALPSSGKYKVMSDWGSDFAYSISNVRYRWSKVISSAQTSYGWIACGNLTVNDAGEFKDTGTYIDFSSNFTELRVHVNIADSGQRSIGGWFKMNLAFDSSATAEVAGTEYNEADNSATLINQNEQIISEQEETNGLLGQIIQHISDQLYALWDQIYNLMALPWKTEQHNDSIDTQEKLDDIDSSVGSAATTIDNSITAHGNFIIEGLKGLFIPDDNFFRDYNTELNQFFEDHLGILFESTTFVFRLVQAVTDPDQVDGEFYFPGISFDLPLVSDSGYHVTIAAAQTIRLEDNTIVMQLLPYIKLAVNMLLTFYVINLAYEKYKEVIRN